MARPHILRDLIADPGPLGLFAFATITLVAGVVKTGWFTSVISGVDQIAFWYGGLAQVIAGILDLLRGSGVTGSTFLAFGLHWMLQGMTMWPGHSVTDEYPNIHEYNKVQGFYFLSFTIIGIGATVGLSRVSYLHIVLLVLVDCIFCLDAVYCWVEVEGVKKTTGYLCVICAALAFYMGLASQWEESNGITLPMFPRSSARKPEVEYDDGKFEDVEKGSSARKPEVEYDDRKFEDVEKGSSARKPEVEYDDGKFEDVETGR